MVKKRISALIFAVMLGTQLLAGCGAQTESTGTEKENAADSGEASEGDLTQVHLEDGQYTVNVTLEGGSGKASVDESAAVTVTDGQAYATIVWSSIYYDYMLVNGEKYLNENEGGNSTFTFPIDGVPCVMDVVGDTTRMSTPHEIDYTLTFEFPEEVSFNDLTAGGQMTLSYANQFSVEQYGAYKLITIVDNGRFLIIPEGINAPSDVPEDVTVLQQPMNDVYMVSSAVMDLVCEIGALSHVSYTAIKQNDWYVEAAAAAMEAGTLTYAGKYSAPDYELLLAGGCNFAVENTMITHNPEVKEKLEELGIQVMIERSSYEQHPLGRLEWIRLFGVLFNEETAADNYFADEVSRIEPILNKEKTKKQAAFFAVSSDGTITVRKPNDYVSSMIELAGGIYSLGGYVDEEENALSTMKMQMEDFYAAEKDADILIYNGIIEGELTSIDDLIQKNELFADFKAVKSGEVYTTGSNFYQQSSKTCDFIEDLNEILTGEGDGEYSFLKKIKA